MVTRTRTRASVAGIAALILLTAVAGGTRLLLTDDSGQPQSLDDLVSPTPVASASLTAPPTASPPPAPDAPAATRPPTMAPTHTPTHRRYYPWPSPTTAYAPLSMTAVWVGAPQLVTTQTALTLRVRLRDGDGDGSGEVLSIDWGDGTSWLPPQVNTAMCRPPGPSPTADPGPYVPEPVDVTRDFGKAYRTPGDYTVTVIGGSPRRFCRSRPHGADDEKVSRTLTVSVSQDPVVTSNGPAHPTFDFLDTSSDQRQVQVNGQPTDTDGDVTQIAYDYGDGSRPSVRTYGLEHCDDQDGAVYPTAGQRFREDDWAYVYSDPHQYAKAGTYTITITVTSAGCSGEDQQTGTATTTVRV